MRGDTVDDHAVASTWQIRRKPRQTTELEHQNSVAGVSEAECGQHSQTQKSGLTDTKQILLPDPPPAGGRWKSWQKPSRWNRWLQICVKFCLSFVVQILSCRTSDTLKIVFWPWLSTVLLLSYFGQILCGNEKSDIDYGYLTKIAILKTEECRRPPFWKALYRSISVTF